MVASLYTGILHNLMLKVKSKKVSNYLSKFLSLLMDPVRPTCNMRHVAYNALALRVPLFVADKIKRALSLSNSSFFLSPYLCLPTHCRCTGYCCTWSHSDTHTHTVGRNLLDEWSVRRRDLYLTTHNTHKRQTSTSSAEFEPSKRAATEPHPRPRV